MSDISMQKAVEQKEAERRTRLTALEHERTEMLSTTVSSREMETEKPELLYVKNLTEGKKYLEVIRSRVNAKYVRLWELKEDDEREKLVEEYYNELANLRDYMIELLNIVGNTCMKGDNSLIDDTILSYVDSIVKLPDLNDDPEDTYHTKEYRGYIASMITRLATIESGRALLVNIFDKRYYNSGLEQHGKVEGAYKPVVIRCANPFKEGIGIHHPAAARDTTAERDAAKVTDGKIAKSEKYVEGNIRVMPPVGEFMKYTQKMMSLLPSNERTEQEGTFLHIDVIMLAHEMIHAIHHAYQVATSHINSSGGTNLEENITSGVVASYDKNTLKMNEKPDETQDIEGQIDEYAYINAEQDVKPAFEVSENKIRRDYGAFRRISYVRQIGHDSFAEQANHKEVNMFNWINCMLTELGASSKTCMQIFEKKVQLTKSIGGELVEDLDTELDQKLQEHKKEILDEIKERVHARISQTGLMSVESWSDIEAIKAIEELPGFDDTVWEIAKEILRSQLVIYKRRYTPPKVK